MSINNAGQNWNPDDYAQHARFVSDLGAPLLELLAAKKGEHILDLGCGDGVLTQKIAALGCEVICVDSSAKFITSCKELGLNAHCVDGEKLEFENEFDAVFSNAALHWMKDAQAVVSGVHRALKPGGRLVAEFGGAGNVQKICSALQSELEKRGVAGASHNPWYFPTPAAYQTLLEANGFEVQSIALIPRPTPLPGDVHGWLKTFAQSFCHALPEADREKYLLDVQQSLRPQLCNAQGIWIADYMRLRVVAFKST